MATKSRLLIVVAVLLLGSVTLTAQAAEKVLTRTNVVADEVLNALIGKSLKGKITSLSVVKNEGSSILLDVKFAGYESFSEVSFKGRILNAGRPVGRVDVEDHSLTGPDGTVRIALQITDLPTKQTLESETLVISVHKKSRLKHKYTYDFKNSWGQGSGSTSENTLVGLVKITPTKIQGEATNFQFVRKMLVYQPQQTQTTRQTAPAVTESGPAGDAQYIKAKAKTKRCFHKKNNNWDNGNPVHLWDCNVGQIGWKTWIYEQSTGYIRNAGNKSKCLQRRQNNWNNGNPMQLWDCTGGSASAKSWNYNSATGRISARYNTKKCLHRKSNHWNNGNVLHLWDCAAGPDASKSWQMVSSSPMLMAKLVLHLPNTPETPAPEDTSAQGPSTQVVPLLAGVGNTQFENSEFLGIKVYSDINPDSGVFYYRPLYYSLDWDRDSSTYGMDITYGVGDADKQVLMGMRLRSSHLLRHRNFVEDMLKKQYENFEQLLEIGGDTKVTLPASLSTLFGVSSEDITAQSPALSEVLVSWVTDPVGQETLVGALTGQMGVSGEVFLYPDGKDGLSYNIPLYAHLATRRTFGDIEWKRNAGWLNNTVYPITLKKMHAMKIGNSVSIDSWDLGQTLVPSQAQVEWMPDQVPKNILQQYAHVWFEYEVGSCVSCDFEAVGSILGDISEISAKPLNVTVMTPIASCGLGGAVLKIRSRYLSPGKDNVKTIDLNIHDGQQLSEDLYFSNEGRVGAVGEYQIVGILPSGQPLQSSEWLPIDDMVLYVGPYQLTQLYGDKVSCD